MYSAAAAWMDGMFLKCMLGSFDLAYGSSHVSWLIFSLDDLSVDVNGVLKSHADTVLRSVSPFLLLNT